MPTSIARHPAILPSDMVAVRGRLTEAIARLEQFDVPVPKDCRLRVAVVVLTSVITADEFPTTALEFTKFVNAMELAEDFHAITAHLPTIGQGETRTQLKAAIRGSLAATEDDREPFRYQSQHWVGAMLREANLNPRIPVRRDRLNPDFIVQPLTSDYGVEVKRPMYERNVRANVEKAAEQLASFGLEGAVLVDVSDCVRQQPMASFQIEVQRLSDLIDGILWNDAARMHRPGYGHVFMAAAYARGAWIVRPGPPVTVTRENYFLATLFRYGKTASFFAGDSIHRRLEIAIAGEGFTMIAGRR